MELVDNLYVYVGENQPNVKLTRIEQFATVAELAAFFAELQEEYNVQFDTCETITDNLKVTCSSYGCKGKAGLPFYLVDYDGDGNCFHLWKTDGDWKNARVFAMLHEFHSQDQSAAPRNWEKYLLTHPDYINSPIRDGLQRALGRLNVDWAAVNLPLFWAQFGRIYTDLKDKRDMENVNTIKMLVSLALLRCNVILNKGKVASQLSQFHRRAVRKFQKHSKRGGARAQRTTVPVDIDAATNSDSAESSASSALASIRESSADSALHNTSTSPVSPASHSENLYTYQKEPLNTTSDEAASTPVVNQVLNNYYSHFKMMAEDYEQFELKTKFNRARPASQSRRRRKSNTKKSRISKIK